MRVISRVLRAGFLYPALFLFIILLAKPSIADFRFAVMGDSRGDSDGINVNMLRNFLGQARSEKADFIIFAGDLITGSKHKKVHKARLAKWKGIAEEYGMPVYIAVGNHEIESETSEDVLRMIFEMPAEGPPGLEGLAYSFDYQNAHFVILDTSPYDNFHRLGSSQLEWLKGDMDKNNKGIIFVFGHEPAYPFLAHVRDSLDKFPQERDELWNIFKEHRVSVYFCSHEHLYNRSLHDGVYQVITGGAGARLHAKEGKGGFYHFLIIDVKDNGSCEISVKDSDGKIRDRFNIYY